MSLPQRLCGAMVLMDAPTKKRSTMRVAVWLCVQVVLFCAFACSGHQSSIIDLVPLDSCAVVVVDGVVNAGRNLQVHILSGYCCWSVKLSVENIVNVPSSIHTYR